ncbi:MAG TPA: hypothetical protein VE136_00440 [Anaerolineales bacterium]|nr:hypothetical protein [Anaerolineales bacterium]
MRIGSSYGLTIAAVNGCETDKRMAAVVAGAEASRLLDNGRV